MLTPQIAPLSPTLKRQRVEFEHQASQQDPLFNQLLLAKQLTEHTQSEPDHLSLSLPDTAVTVTVSTTLPQQSIAPTKQTTPAQPAKHKRKQKEQQ